MRNFSIDEFESIHCGWKILNGENIYEDFIQQKNPVLYYMLAVVVYIFGESLKTLMASSMLILVFTFGILFYTFKLSDLLFDRDTARLSLLLLPVLPWFALSGFEIRPDVPMLCFSMASLYYLYSWLQIRNIRKLIASAILLSTAYLFIQKAAFWFVIIMCIFIHRYARKEIAFRYIGYYIFAVVVVYGLFLMLLSLDISLASYFMFTGKFIQAQQSILGSANIDKLLIEVTPLNRFAWLIIPAYLASVVTCKMTASQWEIALAGILMILTVFLVIDPRSRYFMPAMPLFAIIISNRLVRLAVKYKITPVIVYLLVILLSGNYIALANENNVPGTVPHDRERQLSRVKYVLDLTSNSDYVYDGLNRFNLFRRDLDFVWLGGSKKAHHAEVLKKIIPYHYDIYELIREKKPAVISHYYLTTTEHPWLLRRYRRSDKFEDVYEKIKNNTGFDFWYTFADTIGSKTHPEKDFFTPNGDIEITMTKASVRELDDNLLYPYVGLALEFDDPGIAVDMTDAKHIYLIYKLSGAISVLLSQEGIPAGEEFRTALTQTNGYTEVILNWKDFKQPEYVSQQEDLQLDKITGIKFQISSDGPGKSVLGIRKLDFHGISPDDLSG